MDEQLKYLLVMHCKKDGYWDTSGHCHWSTPEFYKESEFDLEDKNDLIRAIAKFKFEHPKGNLSLYKIQKMTWAEENDILKKADPIVEKLKLEEKRREEEEIAREEELFAQKQKAAELEQLRKLQEKYGKS